MVLSVTDDDELVDFLDDYLTEECNIEYDFLRTSDTGLRELVFKDGESFDEISKYVTQVPESEIERIYALNNK